MELYELNVFLTVVSERSFSRAAGRLCRTQPAVSQAIRRLEVELGQPLFDRSSRGGRLTEAGRVLQQYAARLIRLADEAASALREVEGARRSRVVIGASDAAVYTLLPLICRFRRGSPNIKVEVRRVPPAQIPTEVAQGTLDCGVVTSVPPECRLRALGLGHDDLVVLAHPDHPLATLQQVTVEDLANHTVMWHSDGSLTGERASPWPQDEKVSVEIGVTLPTVDGLKRAVEWQMGVALLSRHCAEEEIASGRLVAIPLCHRDVRSRLHLIFPGERNLTYAAGAFLDAVGRQSRHSGEPTPDVFNKIDPVPHADPRGTDAVPVRAPRTCST